MHDEKNFQRVGKKSPRKIIAQKLKTDYGLLGDKVIDLLSSDILTWYKEVHTDAQTLSPGQTVWLAVDVTEKHHPHKRLEDTRLTPVKLTIHASEDITLLLSPAKKWRDVIKQRIARLFTEAYAQGGVLTQVDVGVLLGIHHQTVCRFIAEYEKETGVNLPYRGRVHDIGPAVSHKAEIVELMVKGYATPLVADKMNHSISSCDRYIKDFNRVIKLGKVYTLTEISTLTGMSERLIKEYITLAEKLGYQL